MSNIIVLAEHESGELVRGSLSAVQAARVLAEKVGGGFDIAIAGSGIDTAASQLTGYGAATVYQLEGTCLAGYTAQAYAQAFDTAVKTSGAQFVLAAATSRGKDCIPRVAARLGAGQASDIVAINGDAVEALVNGRSQQIIQHKRRNHSICRQHAQQSCHVRMNHARSFGHAANRDRIAAGQFNP